MFEALLAAAAKPAATGFTSLGRRWWASVTFNRRAASWIAAAARSNGVEIDKTELRRAMAKGRVRQELEQKGSDSKDAVLKSLSGVRVTTINGTPLTSKDLFDLIGLGYVRTSSPADGLVAVTREVRAVVDAVEHGASHAATFPHNLERLTPPLAAEARRLRDTHETLIPRLVSSLVAAEDRQGLLVHWGKSRPEWLEHSPEIDGWLAEVASEHDARLVAAEWFKSAVTQGATPTAYWKVRWVVTAEQDDDGALEFLDEVADHPLVQSILASNTRDIRSHWLEQWNPTTATQFAYKAALSTQILAEAGDYASAIEQGKRAFLENGFYAAGLTAVTSHLRRGAAGGRPALASDFTEALRFALIIRDKRRAWKASSGQAVAHAMHACELLFDSERAWKLSQLPPVGEATLTEAAHRKVREAAIVLMSEGGSVEDALNSIATDVSYSKSAQLQVRAREAELLSDESLAHSLRSQAIEATTDWNEKATIAYRQAYNGVLDPFVESLRPENSEIADEIQLIFELFSRVPGAESRAKKSVTDNRRVAHALIQFLADEARIEDMTSVAERSARHWGDAADWLRASRGHQHAQRFAEALDRAGKAILAGGPEWGNKGEALAVQVECAAHIEDWATAIFAAQQLVTLRPMSSQARWALVRSHLNAGEDTESFDALMKSGAPLAPSNAAEAQAWLYLFRQHGAAMATLGEVKEIAKRFANDQHVRNLALGAAMFAPRETDDDPSIAAVLLSDYERDYPDSTAFKALHGDSKDPAALLAQLDAIVETRADLSELEQSIFRGSVPIGLLSVLSSGFFAEKLIQMSQRPRFAGHKGTADAAKAAEVVATAIGSIVVADTTALLTLALIPETLADDAARSFAIRTSSRQLIDANASRESLSRGIGGYFVPSSADGPAHLEQETEEEHARRRSVAVRLVGLFVQSERNSVGPDASSLPTELRDLGGVWNAALDLAYKQGLPFWCDDAATRHLASAVGVASFGTPALIEHLREEARVSREVADAADAALLQAWCIDVPYRTGVYNLALQLDQHEPLGVAASIRHSHEPNAEKKILLVLSALQEAYANPEWLQRWVFLATDYIISITEERSDQAENMTHFLGKLLVTSWMSSSTFLFVAGAMRAADGDLWAGALPAAFRCRLSSLVDEFGYEFAGEYVRGLISTLPESERLSVIEVVLER